MPPTPVLLLVAALATLPATANAPRIAKGRSVQISRDEYGIPHVHGRTDADAVFGFAYAQAEDNFFRVEEDFILAIGRASEVRGERALRGDRLNRALGVEAASRAEYRAMTPRVRGLVDAYAEGVNHYLATHPTVKPRLLTKIEPWYPLAFIRYNYFQQGFARDDGMRGSTFQTGLVPLTTGAREAFPWEPRLPRGLASNIGSNGWVVGPSKSASGHPLLFINPHLSFLSSGQVYEGHVQSDEGWNFTGYTRFGFPFPYVGHNSSLGWVSTDNAADLADTFEETFDDPKSPLGYRYGTGYRTATERIDTIRVSTDHGMEAREFRFVRTHHGPIIGARNGKLLAIRMAHFDDEGWLAEWYAMTKARTVKQLRESMRPQKMLFGNVMAADSLGHIWYLYNGAVPRRDPSFAWGGSVDGSNPRTEWKGYHSIDDLPELLDPATGWMQNCNTSPFHLTSAGNPDSLKFPAYMVRESMNPRGVRAMQILGGQPKFTFDEWRHLAFDTRIVMADSLLPKAIPAMRATSLVQSRADLREALDTLERWNHRGDTMSVATTVFTMWREWEQRARGNGPANDLTARSLELAIDSLKGRAGSWKVPWGAVNRLRRPDESTGETPFTAASRPSVGVPGTNGSDGAVFTFYTSAESGLARYGGSGGTYISVVEFGPKVRALAVHTFGASGDPASPHFFDQAPLYARGEFRGSWLTTAEVKAHAGRTYKP